MNLTPQLSHRVQTERVIAGGRVALAAAALFGVWWDPGEPSRAVAITYTLSGIYLAYAIVLMTLVSVRPPGERLPIVTHVGDIIFVSILQYLTLGPSSPFFLYFVFSLFCATLRWDWKGTLVTAGIVLTTYVIMAAWMSHTLGPFEFEGERFVIRCVYLLVVAAILVYLSRHQQRLRLEIDRLARWPQQSTTDLQDATAQLLSHAAAIVNAANAMVIWDVGEEPDALMARWPADGARVSKHPPGTLSPSVSPNLDDATFVATGSVGPDSVLLIPTSRGNLAPSGGRLGPAAAHLLSGFGLASAPFRTEHVAGRVFFTGFTSPASELVPLTEVVAREIGASLNQLYVTEQMKEIAAGEERIRLARDLHDGVLQSLTGIRLEIQAVAGALDSAPTVRDRILGLERALAIEQRELRFFISGLGRAGSGVRDHDSLAGRLNAVRERVALEWKMPVTIRCAAEALPPRVENAVPLMVHEAIVNALKHGEPSRVAVTLEGNRDELRIIVADDGHGFPFRGRYTHQALAEGQIGPKSLLDRVAALGGEVSVESSDAGSRVEMVLSL